jgi:hypothetical protein
VSELGDLADQANRACLDLPALNTYIERWGVFQYVAPQVNDALAALKEVLMTYLEELAP